MHPFWVSGYWTPGLVINITSGYALWVSLASVSKWKDTRISRLCAASVFDICIWRVFFYYGKKILTEMAFFSYSQYGLDGKKSVIGKSAHSKRGVLVRYCPNASTTPITAMGCRQCLPLSVVHLKGKHCRKPHCRNGVVDTFRPCLHESSVPRVHMKK